MNIKKVIVGISGGVDSLMTAWYLKNKGYEVLGVTFIMDKDQFNTGIKSSVEAICKEMGVKHTFMDISNEFQQTVLQYFKNGYLNGETPNPCTFCNQHVKWPKLKEVASQYDADYIAMGHYAQVLIHNDVYCIARGVDPEKDQSFFLWGLNSEELKRVLLPLGNMTKDTVKEKAKELGYLELANKKESTGPCFVDTDYRKKLYSLLNENEDPGGGVFLSDQGEILGTHNGYVNYTITQRRGLGLNVDRALYVKNILPDTNQVVLGDQKSLWRDRFSVRDYHLNLPDLALKNLVEVKIRYRKQKTFGRLTVMGDVINVELNKPEWGISPGQTAVFYVGNIVVGGGYINKFS